MRARKRANVIIVSITIIVVILILIAFCVADYLKRAVVTGHYRFDASLIDASMLTRWGEEFLGGNQ